MKWDSFLQRLYDWFNEHELLAPGAHWVVGVSGGPDSTLLAHAMRAVSEEHELGWKLHIAHLHHGLRAADADADADFVEELARRLGLDFHVERVDVRREAAENGGSIEEVARRLRYEFLERVALRTGSELATVAHHADDDVETILHRICRGTGIRGLAGMREIREIRPSSRVRLVRPMLKERRDTIESLCEERGIEARADATNHSAEFTRGRIRHVVIPTLREHLNQNVADTLLRLGEQARWLETYLRDAAARTFESLLVLDQPDHIVLNIHALLGKQRIIQAEVIRRAVSLLPGGEQDLSFTHIDSVLRMAAENGSGKELHLPGSITVRKVYDRLEFSLRGGDEQTIELQPVFIKCPGATTLPQLNAELTAEICEVDAAKVAELRGAAHPYEEWLDYDRLQLPLLVRGRRDGDRFNPLGVGGAKSLSDFFIDEKIDPAMRARTGVLCDQAGVVWIMPLRIDERVKLDANSRRALRLVLTPTSQGSAART